MTVVAFVFWRGVHPAGVAIVMLLPPRAAMCMNRRSLFTTPAGTVIVMLAAPAAPLLLTCTVRYVTAGSMT